MELFAREFGAVGAPAIVLLHGAEYSGRSWKPVIEHLQQYHCLVPDLPQHGRSARQGPFEMGTAAAAVAELVRSRVGTGRVHLVGLSLGAQVGVQLLATEPELIDRAVLCGTVINDLPAVPQTRLALGLFARLTRSLFFTVTRNAHYVGVVPAKFTDHRAGMRFMSPTQLVNVVEASAGFTLPEGLGKVDSPTLFLTGAKEIRLVHRSAATLAQQMPNGVDRVVTDMGHDWPLRYPDLFSRTVDGWLSGTALPPEVAAPDPDRR